LVSEKLKTLVLVGLEDNILGNY